MGKMCKCANVQMGKCANDLMYNIPIWTLQTKATIHTFAHSHICTSQSICTFTHLHIRTFPKHLHIPYP